MYDTKSEHKTGPCFYKRRQLFFFPGWEDGLHGKVVIFMADESVVLDVSGTVDDEADDQKVLHYLLFSVTHNPM